MDDKAIEAIVSMVMDLQDRENTSLPLYEQQLREAETGIQNLLNAIQQGILTKSTKSQLEELEATKEDLEIKIANEKIAKPRISPEFVTFWLHKFRKLDVRQQSHRKMLIDAFVNAIYLYDDKLVLTFNYKDGTRTITLDDVKDAVKNNTGSDLDCLGAPKKSPHLMVRGLFSYEKQRQDSNPSNGTFRWNVPATSANTELVRSAIESCCLYHIGASSVSLAPTFFIKNGDFAFVFLPGTYF